MKELRNSSIFGGLVRAMLRIISGEHKGRIIKSVTGRHTRPTTDKVKESLFNILQPKLPGAFVLDLFSGTGNLGLESLSRGAENVVFVERDRAALHVLYENCHALGYDEYSDILPYDFKRAITRLSEMNKSFDIVLMDPPYEHGLEVGAIQALDEGDLVKNDGIIVVEHLVLNALPQCIGKFSRYDLRKYGNTAISFYGKETCHQ
jgi:16S rRNA (guanine966-N2)-methyltransferase